MKKSSSKQTVTKDGNIPRHVRMPPDLDTWLEEKAAAAKFPPKTVADVIREIVFDAREAEQGAGA